MTIQNSINNTKKTFQGSLYFFMTMITYRLVLDFSYVYFVSNLYQYAGFNLSIDLYAYALSWCFYLISLFLLNEKVEKVSDFFFLMAVLAIIAPLTSLYGLDSREYFPVVATLLAYFLIYAFSSTAYTHKQRLPVLTEGRFLSVFFSIFFILIATLWIFASGAISNFNLEFTKVYEFRETNTEILNIGIIGYVNSWVTKVFNLLMIAFFLYKRKYFFVLIFIMLQVLFFSVMAVKSIVFYPFLVIGIWYYFKKFDSATIIPTALIFIMFFVFSFYYFLDNIFLSSWIIRRTFFVPADLTFVYFEFFENNPKVFWSNSILSNFYDYPYSMRLPEVIGNYMGTGSHANNGFISSGFAHAGLLGVIFYSIVVGILLRILNNICTTGIPLWMGVALSVVPFRSLMMNSDLPTTLLTHGLLVTIIFLALLRKKNERI